MATKNKKDLVTSLGANIYDNVNKEITPTKVKNPLQDILNSISVNITAQQLRDEDDSSVHSLANIIDTGRQGIFFFDPLDNVTGDDGAICIVTSATGKRFKRVITSSIDARWFGRLNKYFNDIADANTQVKSFIRFIGLEVSILIGGIITLYWYKNGILDGDLIPKLSEVLPLEFTVGDGGALTPTDGNDTYQNDKLKGATVLIAFAGALKIKTVIAPAVLAIDTIYGQHDKVLGTYKLKNGVYSLDTDYSIIIK